jgi:hypothetical protein
MSVCLTYGYENKTIYNGMRHCDYLVIICSVSFAITNTSILQSFFIRFASETIKFWKSRLLTLSRRIGQRNILDRIAGRYHKGDEYGTYTI